MVCLLRLAPLPLPDAPRLKAPCIAPYCFRYSWQLCLVKPPARLPTSPDQAALKHDLAQILIKSDLIIVGMNAMKDKISQSKTGGLCIYFSTATGDRPNVDKLLLLKKRGGFESVGFKFHLNLAAGVIDKLNLCSNCYRLRDDKCTCISARARAGPSRSIRRAAGSAAWAAILDKQRATPQ